MAIKINNKSVNKMMINGKEVLKVVINGDTKYQKVTAEWHTVWTGSTVNDTFNLGYYTKNDKKNYIKNFYELGNFTTNQSLPPIRLTLIKGNLGSMTQSQIILNYYGFTDTSIPSSSSSVEKTWETYNKNGLLAMQTVYIDSTTTESLQGILYNQRLEKNYMNSAGTSILMSSNIGISSKYINNNTSKYTICSTFYSSSTNSTTNSNFINDLPIITKIEVYF